MLYTTTNIQSTTAATNTTTTTTTTTTSKYAHINTYIHKHFSILYMHTCMHMCVFIYVCECMCVCIYMFLDIYAYIHACINSYTQAQIHTFILLTSIFDYVLTLQLILLDQLYPILVLIKLQQTMIIVAVDVVVLQYC